jgi:hypothetical protein
LLPLRPDGATPSGTGKPYFRISRRIGRRERPQAEQARPYLGFFFNFLQDFQVKNVQGGEGKIVAKLTFVNGAAKWAIIDKDRAVLLW